MATKRILFVHGVSTLSNKKLEGYSYPLQRLIDKRFDKFYPEHELEMREFLWADSMDRPGDHSWEYLWDAVEYGEKRDRIVKYMLKALRCGAGPYDLVVAHSLGSVLFMDAFIEGTSQGFSSPTPALLTIGSPLGSPWMSGSYLDRAKSILRLVESELLQGDLTWVNMAGPSDPISSGTLLPIRLMNVAQVPGYRDLGVVDKLVLDSDRGDVFGAHGQYWTSKHVADEVLSLLFGGS